MRWGGGEVGGTKLQIILLYYDRNLIPLESKYSKQISSLYDSRIVNYDYRVHMGFVIG